MMHQHLFIKVFDMKSKFIHFIQAGIFTGICFILIVFFTELFISNDILGRLNVKGVKYEKDADVILMGPSTLIDFFNPYEAWNEYGITSYNYSGTGFRSDLSKYYIEDIRRNIEPKLFVIEISTMDTVGNPEEEPNELGLRNWADSLFFLNPIRIGGINDYLPYYAYEPDEASSYYVPIIKYHTNYAGLTEASHWKFAMHSEEIHGSYKGYYGLQTHTITARPRVTEDRADRDEIPLHYLNEILDYCDQNNLNVLFIHTPNPLTYKKWTVYNTWGDIITERGYRFLNMDRYYDEIGMDAETDYANYGHVNHQGAGKCTSFLAKYLMENYDLSDHRDDELYSYWWDEYETYEKEYEVCAYYTQQAIEDDVSDKEIGEKLCNTDDFDTWYYNLINSNLDVIICTYDLADMSKTTSTAYNNMMDRWKMDPYEGDLYTAIYRGDECMYSSRGEETGEVDLGFGGLKVECSLSALDGTYITYTFDEEDISFHGPLNAGVNIVIYDNAYYTVRDSVTITVDNTGNVKLARE